MYPNRTAYSMEAMESAAGWFEQRGHPEPWGLCAGIGAVAVGQVLVILYHLRRRRDPRTRPVTVQGKQPAFELRKDLQMHFGSPESIAMLVCYLSAAWFGFIPLPWGMNQLPLSYFNWHVRCNPVHVVVQLLCVDAFMYAMHRFEHLAGKVFYAFSHKPHHRFINPQLFNAFNGSVMDTFTMILVPLHFTCQLCRFCSLLDYIAFGFTYANYLMLIHSEYPHCWDGVVSRFGIGTPADHHVHHARFVWNYGHIFTYWDRLLGTYAAPHDVFKNQYLTRPSADTDKRK